MDLTEAEYRSSRTCLYRRRNDSLYETKITPEIVKTAMQDLEKYTATK